MLTFDLPAAAALSSLIIMRNVAKGKGRLRSWRVRDARSVETDTGRMDTVSARHI